MSNFKKLLSMLLAIVMICSTLVVGASAKKEEYKDAAIKKYDAIDQPVFTAEQLATVALDAVDAMLADIENPTFKIPIINVVIRFSSIDNALDSLENVYNGNAWTTVTSIAGDLGKLQFKALNSTASKNFAAEGVRRRDLNKSDLDVIYSIFQFLYDNGPLLASYGDGSLNLGSTLTGLLEGLLPEINAYLNAPNLLKGLIYDLVYDPDEENGYPEWDSMSDAEKEALKADDMLQLLVDDQMDALEVSLAKDFDWGIEMDLSGVLELDAPSFYDVFEDALQRAYEQILVPLGNTQIKKFLYEILGVDDFSKYKITQTVQVEKDGVMVTEEKIIGYYLDDCADITKLKTAEYNFPAGNSLAEDVAAGNVKLNEFGALVNVAYEIEDYDFKNSETNQLLSEFNNILGQWFSAVVRIDGLDWVEGSNDKLITNIENIAKYILKNYGERFLSQWITIPSEAEIDALTLETGIVRFGRELLEKFAENIILPEDAQSVRSIVTYALCELIADKDPSEDIYGLLIDKTIKADSDEGWQRIAVVIARYYLNSITNMNIPTGLTFEQTIEHIVNWALTNYGGILDYASELAADKTKTAWQKLDGVIFGLIPMTWLPEQARVLNDNGQVEQKTITSSKDIILDILLGNLLDCRFEFLLDLFDRREGGPLDQPPVEVIFGTVERIINAIIPNMFPHVTTAEDLLKGPNLKALINGLCNGLYDIRTNLIPAALPLVCMILELTTAQQLEDPTVTYPDFIQSAQLSLDGTDVVIRNSSTGVNTAYRKADQMGDNFNESVFKQDKLYKVEIINITAETFNNGKVTVSNAAGFVLNGGETEEFPVVGTLNAAGLVKFVLSYNILDENGDPLTKTPIEVPFYTYVSKTTSDDDADAYSYREVSGQIYPLQYVGTAGSNNHFLVSAPTAYVTSWDELNDQEYSIGRVSDAKHTLESTISFKNYTAVRASDGADVSAALTKVDFPAVKTTKDGYEAAFKLFNLDITQVNEEDFASYAGVYNINLTLNFTATMSGNAIDKAITRNVVLYNDFGLPGLVGDAMSANRQKANYNVAGTTLWEDYVEALDAAQNIILAPKTIDTFDAINNGYEDAAANLKAAIEALDAVAEGAGVESLEAIREQYQPSNPEGMEYDDPKYNYMGSEDFVLFTYERYADHRDHLDSLINSQKAPEHPGADATAEELAAYEKALAEIPTLKLFDINYAAHMYKLNAERLVRRPSSKNYLQHAYDIVNLAYIAGGDGSEYSTASWTALDKAVKFARSILQDTSTDIPQTKINRARHELVAAYKGLASKDTDPANYDKLINAIKMADAILAIENYEAKFTGIDAFKDAYQAAIEVEEGLLAEFQEMIDNIAQALEDAVNALVPIKAGLDFSQAPSVYEEFAASNTWGGVGYQWSPATKVFDNGGNYIDGLLLEYFNPINTIIATTGGAELVVTPNENNYGGEAVATGDIITVEGVDYTLVVYGDVDGTARCDIDDISQIIALANWELSAEEYEAKSAASLKAADIVADNIIDISDVSYASAIASMDIFTWQIPQDGTFSGALLPQ